MITPDQWEKIERHLSVPYGHADLMIDGYEISLRVELYKKLRYAIAVYVDGYIRGEWVTGDFEEKTRFWRKRVRHVYSKKEREEMAKLNRKMKRLGMDVRSDPNANIVLYTPYWMSFKPLKRHLIKHNTSIEIKK